MLRAFSSPRGASRAPFASIAPRARRLVAARGGSPLAAELRTVRPVEAGEEITYAYVDVGADRCLEDRRRDLMDYGFCCACARCRTEAEGAVRAAR